GRNLIGEGAGVVAAFRSIDEPGHADLLLGDLHQSLRLTWRGRSQCGRETVQDSDVEFRVFQVVGGKRGKYVLEGRRGSRWVAGEQAHSQDYPRGEQWLGIAGFSKRKFAHSDGGLGFASRAFAVPVLASELAQVAVNLRALCIRRCTAE